MNGRLSIKIGLRKANRAGCGRSFRVSRQNPNGRVISKRHPSNKFSSLRSERTQNSSAGGARANITINGRSLSLSNLEKVFYPKAGFTKGQVIDYYARVAKALLPHLKDRALTLKRYPDGVEGEFFYEKRCPSFRPSWMKTAPIWSSRQGERISYCLANDLPSLIWAANLADLELHTSLARYQNPQRPTVMVFDLDPGDGTDMAHCVEAALWVRKFLAKQHLDCFPKTSGSKGLQVYVPLNTPVTFDDTKRFARRAAEMLTEEHPDQVLYRMEKRLRKGKVFIDWSQNDDHKTTVCVYSLRAKARPSVSTPLKWQEVEGAFKAKAPVRLSFESHEVLKRVEKWGDLFAPVLKLKQKLPRLQA
jgi:bifunctional non-homologous end joining protein LigD